MENSLTTKDVNYAKAAISALAAENKSQPARLRMAQAAATIGNYTPEGKAAWAAYVERGAPAA